jgi:hypothetical protein
MPLNTTKRATPYVPFASITPEQLREISRKGGFARAASLTAERRREIAIQGGSAKKSKYKARAGTGAAETAQVPIAGKRPPPVTPREAIAKGELTAHSS